MAVTLCGIAISILSRDGGHHLTLSLLLKGVLLGIGAGLGQGVRLVLSKVGVSMFFLLKGFPSLKPGHSRQANCHDSYY